MDSERKKFKVRAYKDYKFATIVILLGFCIKMSMANDFPSLLIANASLGISTFVSKKNSIG